MRAHEIITATIVWLLVGVFWLFATRSFHPIWPLALITTGVLTTAYATAFFVNHLILIPRYWNSGRYFLYATTLLFTMAVLTAVALAVIRTSYFVALGPDPDPNGAYVHYAIDFLGMTIHLLVAATVVKFIRQRQAK